jgi:palmitoyltransferase ZDHHC13/17
MPGILALLISISIVGISTMILNRLVFPNAYFGVHNPIIISPYLAGVFAASSAWTVVEYLFVILPQTYSQAPFLNLGFTIVFGIMIYSFLKSMLMDPGFVPLLAGVSEQKGVIEELIGRGEFDSRHFCVASYIRKPLRSKYDKKYKRVVARFDHNCPWVNNVIGIRNHRFFVIYVTSLFVGILLLDWLYFFPFKSTQSPFKYFTFTSLLVIWDTFQLTWVFLLVFVQFIQISKSVTTSEASNLHRFGFMGADDFSSLPLDHQATAVDDNGSANATPAFKAAHRYEWWNKTLRLLGVDHFLHTAQDTVNSNRLSRSRWKERNPTDNGMYRNCMDFWFPSGHNIFQTFPRGEGSIDGQFVDYYSLFEFAKRKGGQQRDYELLEQQA